MLTLLIQTVGFCLCIVLVCRFVNRLRRYGRAKSSIAFFHPYCNSLGGGERVLWSAISAITQNYSDYEIFVYTGDNDVTDEQILNRVKQRFGVEFEEGVINFVRLRGRKLIDARLYPVCTLVGQSLGGFLLGLEAMVRYSPDVFIDSTGISFTLPVFRFLVSCRTLAYVHYPTISTDMLDIVRKKRNTYNNNQNVTSSTLRTNLKLVYYKLFAFMYRISGYGCELAMVNSTWTFAHISKLWNCATIIVYPPCDVTSFSQIDNEAERILQQENKVKILSVGQFRPEKEHEKQLKAVAMWKNSLLENGKNIEVELILMGGCRNEEDEQRVEYLKELAIDLEIEDNVVWKLNAPFEELIEELTSAMIYLHTMCNEHFGIGIVEGMCAGCIVVAHNSGGPRADIVLEGQGLLAATDSEFAAAIDDVINMTPHQRDSMRHRATKAAHTFSDDNFANAFTEALHNVLQF